MAESWESFRWCQLLRRVACHLPQRRRRFRRDEAWQAFQPIQAPPTWVMNPGSGANDPVEEEKGLGFEAARGTTFGLINKIAPESVLKNAETFTAEHPRTAVVAKTVGSAIPGLAAGYLPLAGLQAGATLPAAIGANALTGAAAGAASGYGESEDHPIRDTVMGGVTGAGLGALAPVVAEAARPLLQGLVTRISPGAQEAAVMRTMRQRIMQDAAAGGPSIEDMRDALLASPDKPLGLVDVGGSNMQGLAGSVARTPGKPKETATQFFTDRDVNATPRLLNDIENHVSSGGDAYTAIQTLANQRDRAARPLYVDAFAKFDRPLSSPRLQEFLQSPDIQAGLKEGIVSQGRQALAEGRPFNPADYSEPNLQTLDAAKRGLDKLLYSDDRFTNQITGRRTQDGKDLEGVRQAFVQELDNLTGGATGAYAQARAAWGGPSQMMDAMRFGQNFKTLTPPEIAAKLQDMSPSERQSALLGVGDAIRKDVMSAALSGDESKKAVNSLGRMDQLRPFFQDDATYRKFLGAVLAERRMFETQTNVMRGSPTAGRLAEDSEGGKGLIPSLAQLGSGAAALFHGEPFAGVPMLTRGAIGTMEHLRQPSPRIAEGIADKAFNPDLAANLQTLGGIAGARAPQSPIPYFVPGISEGLSGVPADFLGRRTGQ